VTTLVPSEQPATPTDIALGVGSVALESAVWMVGLGFRAMRPVVGFAFAPPFLPKPLQPVTVLEPFAARGRTDRRLAMVSLEAVLGAVVPRVIDAVLNEVDITAIVRDHVDLNAIADGIDVNAVAAKVDVNSIAENIDIPAILDRIDLAALAQYVIEEIDLPEIVRESSSTITSGAVRGVRMRSIEVDDRAARIVDKVIRRSRRSLQVTDQTHSADPDVT
jgi:hypothetical protein